MSDQEPLRSIDWRAVLPFTHIFRTFRIAIYPSKLVLALALLLTVYVGGRFMDWVWPETHKAVADEVALYQNTPDRAEFGRLRSAEAAAGHTGLFSAFFHYQLHEFYGVVQSVPNNQWFSTPDSPGVLGHAWNFLAVGPLWLIRVHPLFAAIFAILFLAAWSLFGGAISRLAAVHCARDDSIRVRQAMTFAVEKFLSFASAPIIPAMIVLFVGLLLAIGSLLGNIPYLGPILVGGGFFLALLAGFVQTLVILGTLGGFNLMYPTVAVEGSDSFDAISRSFGYIYARPWRMLFYTAVAVGYGAITYLFLRFFILLTLALAHHFVSVAIFAQSTKGLPLFPSMWPSPAATGHLTYAIDFSALSWSQRVGAGLLSFWIYIAVGILGAFAISFYFCANTIIYLLMRRDLDATAIDEVYLEQSDEDFHAAASAEVEVTVVVETPPPPDPADQPPPSS
jgi:hypothetical protein